MRTYCFFSALYFPNKGGIENYTYNLSQKLIERGNAVIIVTSNVFNLSEKVMEDGITVYRFPCFNVLKGRFPVVKHNKQWHRLYRQLERESIDFIIVHARFYTHSVFGLKYASKHSIPVITIDHGSGHLSVNNRWWDMLGHIFDHWITNRLKQYCDNFFGVSEQSSQWLQHFNIKSKGELYSFINGNQVRMLRQNAVIDYREQLNIPQEAMIITHTCRLVKEKGVKELIQAFNLLNDPNTYLIIAGDGPEYKNLLSLINSRVFLLGQVGFPQIISLLKETDIFCFPSYYPEGFAFSLLEAAACECYIISNDVGGAKQIIVSQQHGTLLSQTSTPEQLCSALRAVVGNKERISIGAKLVRERVDALFTGDITVKRVEDFFEHL